MIIVRAERPADLEAIRAVNNAAFRQDQESRIVDALRENGGVLSSLVAQQGSEIVGHILFSPVTIESRDRRITGAALGPMAVRPDRQQRGIGGQMVGAGVELLRSLNCPFVLVVGHPEYYPRFGFEPASRHAIRCEWDVPDAAFMLLVLDSIAMRDVSGVARFRPEFVESG